jgi:hypothetical protein
MKIRWGVLLVAIMAWPVWAEQGRVNTPLADVSVTTAATLVKAQNLNRVALSCTNTDASIHVRWGSSAVTTTTGQQLRAGSSIEILSTDAVYMIAESSSVTVSCTEETTQ